MTHTPSDWADQFEAAHGFFPPFTPDELPDNPPWCGECCDFHFITDEHSAAPYEQDDPR